MATFHSLLIDLPRFDPRFVGYDRKLAKHLFYRKEGNADKKLNNARYEEQK